MPRTVREASPDAMPLAAALWSVPLKATALRSLFKSYGYGLGDRGLDQDEEIEGAVRRLKRDLSLHVDRGTGSEASLSGTAGGRALLVWINQTIDPLGIRFLPHASEIQPLRLWLDPGNRQRTLRFERLVSAAVALDLVAWINAGRWREVHVCPALDCRRVFAGRRDATHCSDPRCDSRWRRDSRRLSRRKSVRPSSTV